MDKSILHCDLNGFYASVEALDNPVLNNAPMAVSGNPKKRHGIILAKNEIAKSFGVKTGETIWQAKLKCPNLVLTQPHHEKYAYYSQVVNDIYGRFTNRVEPFGIDESWLDVTGSLNLYGTGKEIADKIRAVVKKETRLTVSIGVSFNKVFSKLGSDYKKPDATTVFGREQLSLIHTLPVSDMLYVGKVIAQKLRAMRINTIGDLAKANVDMLSRKFGKAGLMLYEYANGISNDEVSYIGEGEDIKSIGNSKTFEKDLSSIQDIKLGLEFLAEKVSKRMFEQKVKGSVIQLNIKENNFNSYTRQISLDTPTSSRKVLYENALALLKTHWTSKRPIRLLGISCTNLTNIKQGIQLDLFEKDSTKTNTLEETYFAIKDKYGTSSIFFGSNIED